jgi:hypothetical protein
MAHWARPVFAHTTLPRRAQESLAIRVWTRSNKLPLFMVQRTTPHTPHQLLTIPLEVLNINYETTHNLALILAELVPENARIKFSG